MSWSSNDNGNGHYFLGMTKVQFLMAAVIVFAAMLMVSTTVLTMSVRSSSKNAAAAEALVIANRKLAVENKAALCGMKEYAQKQVESTANFLASGRQVPGISRNDLLASLKRQRAFRDTMNGLDCE